MLNLSLYIPVEGFYINIHMYSHWKEIWTQENKRHPANLQRWEFIKENNKLTKLLRKRSRKQERKQELDQESDQEKKTKLSFFLDHFLGRVLVFFLVFLFSFINSHLSFKELMLGWGTENNRGFSYCTFEPQYTVLKMVLFS